VEYEWFVTIVPMPEERSFDYLTSAVVKYADPAPELSVVLAGARSETRYIAYADAGYWYDAMVELSRLIAAMPADGKFRRHRISLLEQVELPPVAAYDRWVMETAN